MSSKVSCSEWMPGWNFLLGKSADKLMFGATRDLRHGYWKTKGCVFVEPPSSTTAAFVTMGCKMFYWKRTVACVIRSFLQWVCDRYGKGNNWRPCICEHEKGSQKENKADGVNELLHPASWAIQNYFPKHLLPQNFTTSSLIISTK